MAGNKNNRKGKEAAVPVGDSNAPHRSRSSGTANAVELQELPHKQRSSRRQQPNQRVSPAIDLPRIDTSIRRTNMGGSHSMPPSPTMDRFAAQAAPIRRYPSIPQSADLMRQRLTPLMPLPGSASFVQSGKMTKVPHYGRIRSVTARILRMIDPRTLAQQHQRERRQKEEERASGVHLDDTTTNRGTAAGVLGLSFVDTVRDAAAVRRRRRFSHGSIPMGHLSRNGSRESRFLAPSASAIVRKSVDLTHPSWLSRPLSSDRGQSESMHLLSPVHSTHRHDALTAAAAAAVSGASAASRDDRSVSSDRDSADASGGNMHDSAAHAQQSHARISMAAQMLQSTVLTESIIAIPMPGFFLDPDSDHWVGGHSFRQRMRFPNEAITVPASLTKRVHYEVSYDYPKNVISTARYNVVTFMPAQLVAQFSKVANLYFLFIAALQQVPGWSTTGQWSTILPLCVFVSLSIAHEGFDDLRRHRMDHAENSQHTRVLKVKVHDRERLSFNFREMRHRGSQSIHSFRMRSSQSIHDIGRNTIDSARRWAGSAIGIGSTIKESVVSRIAEKRRKQREMEDSDDEDEHLGGGAGQGGAPDSNEGADYDVDGSGSGGGGGGGAIAESVLRRQLNRGVMSLRSWRSTRGDAQQSNGGTPHLDSSQGDSGDEDEAQLSMRAHRRQLSRLGGASLAATASMLDEQPMEAATPRRAGPTVAFNDVVEEVSFENGEDEQIENPLPDNMSCRWKKKRWENVQVGDLLKISRDDWIPADCIVIASTGFDGTCFVETASLDGETTLKQKQALEVTNSEIQTPEQLVAFNAFTYVEPASSELYNFEGYMEHKGERYPLTPNQLLLRGSVLRNTAYVYAQAIYCGEQTRLRLNATRNVRTKAPQIQRITNRIVILVFLLLLVLCFVFSALGIHWSKSTSWKHWYLQGKEMSSAALIFGYIVMMNALIPISLYVTLEAVKIFQCWFIQQDVSMYHPDTDTRAEARTTAINEDLGMVRYVFSDKTGTLTENIMKLRAVMVSGFSYLHIDLDRLQEKAAQNGLLDTGGDEDDPGAAEELSEMATGSPKIERTSSRLSFLRSGPLSAGTSGGRQSPSLLRTQFMSKHRRQHSLPSPMRSPASTPGQGPRALQQIAAANRANNNTNSVTGNSLRLSFAKHVRGLSASVLRSPTESAIVDDDDDDDDDEIPLSSLGGEPDSVAEVSSQLESAAEDSIEADPDLTGDGDDDPRAHTKASDDAPVSDLLGLPSSRRIMDSYSPPSEVFRARAEWFLRCMALCHTVQPDRDPVTGRITGYQATSPDEKALVAAAAELGYVMNNRAGPLVQLRVVASERMRDFNRVVIQGLKPNDSSKSPVPTASTPGTAVSTAIGENPSPTDTDATHVEGASAAAETGSNQTEESFDRGVPPPHPTDRLGNYEILDVLEFSSARKRMSVIMRCPDGRVVMMSKGADSAILQRLVKPERLESNPDDTSYLPQPKQKSVFGTLPRVPPPPLLRRKLSQPSAAYLHSRSSSVASSNVDQTVPFDLLPIPPRFSEGFMLYGGESSSPRTPSGLCTSFDAGDDDDDNDESDGANDNKPSIYGTLPQTPPPVVFGRGGDQHHRKKNSSVSHLKLAHRRLISDSQFSAISEASSFGDTQGYVEVPESFETPAREEEEWARARALEALHQFSTEGLRTLMYAHKEIEPSVYEAWHQRYVAASTALSNRQQQVEALCEEIEGDLLLSGVSAIEDRLQGGVPETIFKLRRAGIRVWMLTGDKVETAINIAKSCRLIETDMVETTSLDVKTMGHNRDKMSLLVMQSKTDYDELDRIITDALEVARGMATNIDDRFEKRSRRQKLRRGLKRFGNMLDPRRRRIGKPSSNGDGRERVQEHFGQADTRMSTLRGDDPQPHSNNSTAPGSGDGGDGAAGADQSANKAAEYLETPLVDAELRRPATAIEWANDVSETAPAGGGDSIPHHATNNAIRRSASQSSSSGFSDVTRGVVSKKSESEEAPLSSSGPFGTLVDGSGISGGSTSLAVVVDGETLTTLEQYEGLLDKFLSLGTLCDAVICSRVSPAQKALIVHNMRVRCEGGSKEAKEAGGGVWQKVLRFPGSAASLFKHDNDKYMVTLAIGDGGNDIAMIQEAHVGIGIAGQEGLQASRSADFSIGQFRFLQKLLLVHGRWSYVRVSMFIMGTFYKCMAFYVTQLIFQFYTGFSGTSLFESWTLSMYNTLFSILPVLVVGIFEQDLQPETLMAYPELYRDMGPKNHLFTVPIFMQRVVVIGIVHSVIAAYFPFASNMVLGRDATSDDQYIWSLTIYGIMVMIVTLKIAYVDVRRWVYLSHVSVVLTLVLWFTWNGVLCHVYPSSPGQGYYVLGTFTMLMKKGPFWFQWIIFVAVALCLNVLALLIYTMRDPVEHRIATWVAYERRKEHVRHRIQRHAWLQRRGMASSWELLNFKWLRSRKPC